MDPRPPGQCGACGAALETADQHCRSCGTARGGRARGRPPLPVDLLPRLLINVFAAAAILLLVAQAQLAAYLLAPGGRPQLLAALAQAGFHVGDPQTAVWELTVLPPIACLIHIAAYFGLRTRRAAGWVLAVLVSVGWCLFLVGVPVLFMLSRRRSRTAFGIPF